jgi:hypothetical protein
MTGWIQHKPLEVPSPFLTYDKVKTSLGIQDPYYGSKCILSCKPPLLAIITTTTLPSEENRILLWGHYHFRLVEDRKTIPRGNGGKKKNLG